MADNRPIPAGPEPSLAPGSDEGSVGLSGLRIDITISVGYTRRRAQITDRVEARLSAVGLIIAGATVVIAVLIFIVPRLLALF